MWWNTVLAYLAFTLIACVVYYQWSRRKIRALLANMSGPPKMPLIGHTYMAWDFTSQEKIFLNLTRYVDQYPSPIAVHVGPLIHVIIFTPNHVQTVLNSPHCLSKCKQYEFFSVSRALFSSPPHIWKAQRKAFTPSFGPAILNSFVPVFNEKSATFVKLLGQYVGKEQRDLSHEIIVCALDTVLATAFGVNTNIQQSPDGPVYVNHQEGYIGSVTNRIFTFYHYPKFLFQLSKAWKHQSSCIQGMLDCYYKALNIRNSDEILSKEKAVPVPEEESTDKKPKIFIDKLLELIRENKESKEDIPQHFITMAFAGNDTTATTMTNLLLMLAIHQDVQEQVYQEIMSICPDKEQSVSLEDTAHLTYTEMVCKETMRLFPVGPLIGREATQDIILDDKYTIPAGSTVGCVIYKLHRDPETWGPDADKFNPDNFLPDKVAKRHPYAYLPFSGGPRNCLGVRYAWASMKIMIVHILRRYRLRTTLTMDTLRVRYSIILKILDGCPVTLEERG